MVSTVTVLLKGKTVAEVGECLKGYTSQPSGWASQCVKLHLRDKQTNGHKDAKDKTIC